MIALGKSSATVSILIRELFFSNCYDHFLRLSGFPHLFSNVFLINLKFDFSILSHEQRKQNNFFKELSNHSF